jgi:hypothetical protein
MSADRKDDMSPIGTGPATVTSRSIAGEAVESVVVVEAVALVVLLTAMVGVDVEAVVAAVVAGRGKASVAVGRPDLG